MLGQKPILICTERLLSDRVNYGARLSQGDNSNREHRKGCEYNLHAETDAIRRLPPRKRKRRTRLNLIVIRVNRRGQLRNSKPCLNCIQHLTHLKGYQVQYIFYSTDIGTLIRVRLSDLIQEQEPHRSGRFQT